MFNNVLKASVLGSLRTIVSGVVVVFEAQSKFLFNVGCDDLTALS